MTEADIISEVKKGLGINGKYLDGTIAAYIREVIQFLEDAGVNPFIACSSVSVGVITRGVSDLWNYGASEGKFSEYFFQRVTQLVYSIDTGTIIYFNHGDFGITYPVNVEGMEIEREDIAIFSCDDVVKNYTNIEDNCILITFTKDESEKLQIGTHDWTLKIKKESATVTAVNRGKLIVN